MTLFISGSRKSCAVLIRSEHSLISDGEDNDSRYSFKELRRSLQESDVTIYAIGIAGDFIPHKGGPNGAEILESWLPSLGQGIFPERCLRDD